MKLEDMFATSFRTKAMFGEHLAVVDVGLHKRSSHCREYLRLRSVIGFRKYSHKLCNRSAAAVQRYGMTKFRFSCDWNVWNSVR